MNQYKVTLALRGNPNFVCDIYAVTPQLAIIRATNKAKSKHGRDVNICRHHADLIITSGPVCDKFIKNGHW